MSTSVCPKCGANLDASARFCASCGQAVSAPAGVTGPPPTSPGPAGGKKVPVLPLVIFGGGLVVLVGALTFMRSNAPPGGEAAPGAAPPAPSSGIPTAPAMTGPATLAPPGAPATPATSALSFPDTLPPASPVSPSSPGAPPDTTAGSRAPSTKSWKDPLASGGGSTTPPKQAVTGLGSPSPRPPAGRPTSSAAGRPASPPVPPPVSRTYECRENAIFNITPEDIHITVDGQPIGTADHWDGAGDEKRYVFRGPGVHYVKLSHEKYETVWLKFDVSEDSIYRTADVEVQMKRLSWKGE
jgi:zinc-ribbon domain